MQEFVDMYLQTWRTNTSVVSLPLLTTMWVWLIVRSSYLKVYTDKSKPTRNMLQLSRYNSLLPLCLAGWRNVEATVKSCVGWEPGCYLLSYEHCLYAYVDLGQNGEIWEWRTWGDNTTFNALSLIIAEFNFCYCLVCVVLSFLFSLSCPWMIIIIKETEV